MKTLQLTLLLALIPTFLFCSDRGYDELYGFWYDDYTNTTLEIKHTRKGIKVKEHGGWFPKWRRYNAMGRGVFDDCDGRVIIKRGYNQIEYRKGRRRSTVLYREGRDRGRGYRDRDYRDREYGYGDDRYDDGYRYPSVRSYGRTRSADRYCGSWSNRDRRISLSIEAFGRGFRARYGNDWTYYTPYRDHYRDRRGNRYYFDDDYLCWDSYDGKRRLRFRRG